MSAEARAEAEQAAFETHEAPSWAEDPVARDAAIRWHLRGWTAHAEWQASLPVTDAEEEAAADALRNLHRHVWESSGDFRKRRARRALEAARAVSNR